MAFIINDGKLKERKEGEGRKGWRGGDKPKVIKLDG